MNKSAVRLVCFDLGGVVVRICRSWHEACDVAGIEHERVQPWGDASPEDHLALLHRHQTGCIDLATYAREAARLFRNGVSPEDIAAVHGAWILGEYDGVAEVIDLIHDAGLETATLSNTSADHWEQMHVASRFPSIARIRHRWASHLLGHAKPDPAVYRAFEARVGCKGHDILFFDDLAENIDAALSLGWRAVQIDHAGSTASQMLAAIGEHVPCVARRLENLRSQ